MPKARQSNSLRRIIRFTEKYEEKVVPLRYKLYLPRMKQLLSIELTNLDELERQIFDKLEELGTPSEQWTYYMAFSKRAFKTYLHFSDPAAAQDVALLKQEFLYRGLDSSVLDQLIPICRDKAEIVKSS